MAITKCTEDLCIIAALPDTPAPPQYSTSALKAKFDEAAGKLKTYINDTLIPDIQDELTSTVLGDGAYEYIPCRKLIASYTSPGVYSFSTSEHPSFTGIYDIVLIGGGGGGSVPSGGGMSGCTGGGAGAVTTDIGRALNGTYTVTVGTGGVNSGTSGVNGGSTFFSSADYSIALSAGGGKYSSQTTKTGRGGGIGGGDSEYGDGTFSFGHGGDNAYGRGARGGIIADDTEAPSGYGSGGWGSVAGKPGAVLIYGYLRQDAQGEA